MVSKLIQTYYTIICVVLTIIIVNYNDIKNYINISIHTLINILISKYDKELVQ